MLQIQLLLLKRLNKTETLYNISKVFFVFKGNQLDCYYPVHVQSIIRAFALHFIGFNRSANGQRRP